MKYIIDMPDNWDIKHPMINYPMGDVGDCFHGCIACIIAKGKEATEFKQREEYFLDINSGKSKAVPPRFRFYAVEEK